MPTEMKIGAIPVLNMMDPFDPATPLNIVLWGKPGCGKTLLASTATPPVLFIGFDPGGYLSLRDRPQCFVYDLSNEPPSVCADMQKFNDDARIFNFINQHKIRTLVFDSLTTYNWLALQYAVGKNARTTNSISMETPSMTGYSQRNQVVHQTMSAVLGLTMKLKLDTLILLHEAAQRTKQVPVQGQPGKFVEVDEDITPSVTENIMNSIGVRVGEIWHMTAIDSGHRRIELRPVRGYAPMKTRMFAAQGNACEFNVPFDALTGKGDGISTWVEAWRTGGGRRLALPRS